MRSSEHRPHSTRVLYLLTSDLSARFLRGQLRFLIEHGYDVEVGTALGDHASDFDDGVRVHDVGFVREPSPIADLRALVATIGLIRRIRPGIVNASTPKAGLIGMLASWLCRVPQRVYVVRGLRFETLSGRGRSALRLLERLSTACATDVVFNSPSLLSVAERNGAVRTGRGRVLGSGSGNGIDTVHYRDVPDRRTARSDLDLPTDGPVVGFVGRLTVDKGVVDLVDAFTELADDAVLLLVGDTEPGDPLPASTLGRLETAPNIVHASWVGDTRQAYAAMDVLAFPSYREGLPNVPLEAQLSGTPVVAYAATGTVDAIADGVGGVLVDVGDRDGLRRALARLLADPDRAHHMGLAGADWVAAHFDRRTIWEELMQLYA